PHGWGSALSTSYLEISSIGLYPNREGGRSPRRRTNENSPARLVGAGLTIHVETRARFSPFSGRAPVHNDCAASLEDPSVGSRCYGARLHGASAYLRGAGARLHGASAYLHGAGARLHGASAYLHGAGARL